MTAALRTLHLSKEYRLAKHRPGYRTFREAVMDAVTSPFKRARDAFKDGDGPGSQQRSFWALRDVNLEVGHGDVLGVIGHNGAGKSTLLKILSRITHPTSGRVEIHGRVGSLLEVGTGFHPELTGRENVFLSGAILGMARADIRARFDEIVAFSGVEEFIDTPIKRYSSGMQLRLAFAVAAHLEPEILLIDEVLAVGDAAFQRKCLGKMKDVSSAGRTVLFVSHNLQAVRALCPRACLMEGGKLTQIGETAGVIRSYLDSLALVPAGEALDKVRSAEFALHGLRVSQEGGVEGVFLSHRPLAIEIEYELLQTVRPLLLGFDVSDSEGTQMFRSYDLETAGLEARPPGRYTSTCVLPAGLFQPGTYYFHLLVGIHRQRWISRSQVTLKVEFDAPREYDVDVPGTILPQGRWRIAPIASALAEVVL